MINKNQILDIALEAARAGARVILKNFGKLSESNVKANSKGLVTETDLQSERVILEILQSKSDYKILSEEEGWVGNNDGPVWVVDPLDGTTNFANGLPLFAVSVALMQNNESLAGVIIDPVHNNEYYAIKGEGAFCNGKKLVSGKYNSSYIPTIFLNHGYHEVDRVKFKKLSDKLATNNNLLKLGTTALELCFVAAGSADAFICSGDELWDFAAGIVICQEAGIRFSNWKGDRWHTNEKHLLFAHPEIHKKLTLKVSSLQ